MIKHELLKEKEAESLKKGIASCDKCCISSYFLCSVLASQKSGTTLSSVRNITRNIF